MDKTTRRLIQGMAMTGVLVLTACEEAPEQLVKDFGIAYIKRPIVTEIDQDTNEVVLAETDISEVLGFTEGGDIWYRDRASPSASERNITFCLTRGLGDVRDLETSYDGSRIIFSLRLPDPDPDDDVEPTWDIYEYDTTTGDCPQRIIRSNISADEGDDLAPSYLPDGRIVFTSTRQKGAGIMLSREGKSRFRALDESLNEYAPLLHVMSASGTDIQQISFNQSHDLDPTVLGTGEILFTRWDHMGGRDAMNLYSVRPDGAELKVVYGVHDDSADDVQFLSPRQLEDGRVLVMLKSSEGSAGRGSGAPAFIDIANYVDNTQPVWPRQGVLGGPAQTPVVDLDVRTGASISPNGRFRGIHPLWDGTGRVLTSWSPCRLRDSSGSPRPCPSSIPADAVEAFPFYGIYIIDLNQQTQLPVVQPKEGWIIEEPVVAAPRRKPAMLYDRVAGFELDQNLVDENVGLLHIRSVYDFDGRFNRLGSGNATITSLGQLADPTQVTADERRARFLRIIKSVPIPDRDALDFDRSAFGVSRQQKMREIIGYAPVQPDGSVLIKVPANVPFAISVVDKDGRRIGGRHQNWLQLRPGETLTCNGCHNHNPSDGSAPKPHGAADEPEPVNRGAGTEEPFPGTHASLTAKMGETMAQARIRLLCGDFNTLTLCRQLSPSVNLQSVNEWWIDPAAAPAPAIKLRYDDPEFVYFGPSAPVSLGPTGCDTQWNANCRTIINYETHIHPLWSQARPVTDANDVVIGDHTCTNCHNNVDINSVPRVPASQLDLSDGESDINGDHFKSYRELLSADNEQELVDGVLRDATREVPRLDENGEPMFQDIIDPNTGEVIARIPLFDQVPIPVTTRAMRPGGSRGGTFMGKFLDPTDDHFGYLSATELRLIAEWLDIGAQYYNNPSAAPLN